MIKHIKCDIFESGADIICHQVNCQGVMGSGIAKQVRDKYPWVYAHYKRLCDDVRESSSLDRLLGGPQLVFINERQAVANCFGQLNYGYGGQRYTSYSALYDCFKYLKDMCKDKKNYCDSISYGLRQRRWRLAYSLRND